MLRMKMWKLAVFASILVLISLVSAVKIRASIDPLAAALDGPVQRNGSPLLSFATGTDGSPMWSDETTTMYFGPSAAQSGAVTKGQSSWMETTVTGPVSISFYQKVSSKASYDFLKFTINGVQKSAISGAVSWQQKMYTLSTGATYTLRWTYSRKSSVPSGNDAAWVDKLIVSPNTVVTLVTPTAGLEVDAGATQDIAWNAPAAAEKYKLYYTVDNGVTWALINGNVTSSPYSWAVPPRNASKTKCKVKLVARSHSGSTLGTAISGLFKIKAGGINSLTVASKVSVVSAQTSSNAPSGQIQFKGGAKALLFSAPTLTDLSVTTDYVMDKTNVYVEERTSDAFKTINQILCMMGQTKYDSMLNQGVYTALVDKNLCDSNNSDPSAAGQQAQNQSSGANMPDYMRFTVKSSRTDDDSAEYVSVWVHEPASGQDHAAFIYGKGTITEGSSDTNPYGLFTFNFAGYNYLNDGTLPASPSFKGTLKAVRSDPTNPDSKVLLKFVSYDNHTDGFCGTETSSQQVTLDRQFDGSAGAGLVAASRTCQSDHQYDGDESFQIAYDPDYFYRKDLLSAGSPTCFSRTTVNESAWSYGLYKDDGSRLARNSGFPITYTKNSKQYRGWIGYWGVWTDNNAPALVNGDLVQQVDYHNNNAATNYTVFQAGGKLKKHTKQTLTLGQIQNIPLSYSVWTGNSGSNYQVVWDGSHFNEVAVMPQNCDSNCTWADITPTEIDPAHLQGGTLNFWSDSLGGSTQVPLDDCINKNDDPDNYPFGYWDCSATTLSNATSIIFYAEQVVNPGDTVPATLACYDNCPQGLVSALTSSNPFYLWSSPTATSHHDYTLTTDPTGTNSMVLLDSGNSNGPVVSSSTSTNSNFQYGIMSGALFDPSGANMINLQCPWDAGQICNWLAWSLPVFYTWETGPSSWNQFVTLKDDVGVFIPKFDPPLNVTYVADGTTYVLQYAGFGQLNGIPGKCIDMVSGEDTSCSDNGAIRWVPQFTIPALDPVLDDGTLNTVTDQSDGITKYLVKPLDIEQRMAKEPDQTICSALGGTLFDGYTLPSLSIWVDPKTPEPTAPAAPAVIGGVLQ